MRKFGNIKLCRCHRTHVRTCFPTESVRRICFSCKKIISSVKFFERYRERNLISFEKRNLKRMEDGELEDTKDEEGDDAEAPVSKFAGKKKVVSNNAMNASSFGLVGGGGDDEDNEDSGITERMLVMKNQDNEVAGFAPYKKRKLGTHKRAKKREEMEFVLQKMRAADGGEKKK